jgi:hypothetical protein
MAYPTINMHNRRGRVSKVPQEWLPATRSRERDLYLDPVCVSAPFSSSLCRRQYGFFNSVLVS